MRRELSEFKGLKVVLLGTFLRYGKKKGEGDICVKNTVLLEDLKLEDGTYVCDHLWFVAKKSFMFVEMKMGAVVRVSGVVSSYERSDGTLDYCIDDCDSVDIVDQGDRLLPSKVWEVGEYTYFKFILDGGPRWYRVDKNTRIERVSMRYIGYDIFEIIEIETKDDDREFLMKNGREWLVLGSKIKIKRRN
jgi:hypothetical protein